MAPKPSYAELEERVRQLEQAQRQRQSDQPATDLNKEILTRISACFIGFTPDPLANINRLTALVGECLGATCALYNRLDQGMLCSLGQWQAPPDYQAVDQAQGHICYDVIQRASDEVLVVSNLQDSHYADSDPNVVPYGLQTYIGKAVKFGGHYKGSLCVVFQDHVVPGEMDKELLGIIAAAIGVEEERKRSEDALRQNEAFYKDVFDAIQDGISVLDTELNVIRTNRWIEQQYAERMPLLGRKCYQVYQGRQTPCPGCPTLRTLASGQADSEILSYPSADDNEGWIELFAFPVMDAEGQVTAVIEYIKDITERSKMEQQLQQAQKFEAIGTLAGGVAHDFNNLLMGIQGRASLMGIELGPDHPQTEHIEAIEAYVRSAANLTKQLLGFARGGKYEVKPVDISEQLLATAAMFGRTRKEIRIHSKTPADPLVVEADKRQIEQVLLNIFVNAWQAMPEGGDLYLETSAAFLDETVCRPHRIEPGRYAKMSITDQGIGMDGATRKRIFDPFFTTKDKGRGTGLGLASAYGIVKNHGGIITVYSEVGHGATFNIYLPLSSKAVPRTDSVEKRVVQGSETVLLVDDEAMIIAVGRAMLEKLGYRVVVAEGGRQAVDIVQQMGDGIDLVILDLIMPELDGGKTFDQIRRIRPELPVMLSSGYAINGQASDILQRGCNGFIQKPFNMSELAQKIRTILDDPKDLGSS